LDSKEFKNLFDETAKKNGFEKAFGGWFKESSECITLLDLQKSNFGNYYELNIKTFVQGMFGNSYTKNKNLIKKQIGDIFTRQPNEYSDVLDFETLMNLDIRKNKLKVLFNEFIVPFTDKSLTRFGLKELAKQEIIFIPPAVKEEL
jgi:hypothetical protein